MQKKTDDQGKVITEIHYFKDTMGFTYKLYPSTCRHIRLMHPEIDDPVAFIKKVFDKIFAIYESKSSRQIYLYYNIKSKNLYRVVVANIVDRVIKTAYISDIIKDGDMKWINKSLLLR
jgi:hypothetical protein